MTTLSTDDTVSETLTSADGKLQLFFPAGAIGQAATITHEILAIPANSGMLYAFTLGARAKLNATAISQFAKPLTLTVRPDRFTPDLTANYYELSFFTLNDATGRWETVATSHDPFSHTITARITHFSQWGVGFGSGSNPDGVPSIQGFNQIDRFSGAATVDYPLDVPTARVQPALSLRYSSNPVNDTRWDRGTTHETDAPGSFIDIGWDLNGFSMIFGRPNIPNRTPIVNLVSPAGNGRIMSFSGDSYWHTNDESYAVIQPLGTGPDYWRLWDKSGTQYLLKGLTTSIDWDADVSHSCDTAKSFYNGWYVTVITDTHNNTMTVDYETDTYTTTINCDGYYIGPGGNDLWGFHDEMRTYVSAAHPTRVTYASGNAYLQFIYADKTGTLYCNYDPGSDTPQYLQGACETKRLTEIRVYAYGQRVRTYTLEYASSPVRLWRVTQKERGESPSATLPPYVFAYGTTGNDMDLLTLAQNGYGGEVEFHYGQYNYPPVCDDFGGTNPCGNDGRPWNRYAVISKTVRARQGDGSTWSEFGTSYAYSGMRVHNTTGDLSSVEERSRKFLGFHTVTETVYAGVVGSAVLSSNATDFYQYARDDGTLCYDAGLGSYVQCAWNKINPLHGRVMETRQHNAGGALLSKSKNTYSAVWLKRGDGMQEVYKRYFNRLDQVDQYQCEGTATCVQTRANYVYDGYGNIVSEYQRGNLSTDNDPVNNKSTHRGYIATQNATTYIVNKPNFENVYGTIVGNVGSSCGCWKTQKYTIYDNNPVWYGQTITRGLPTRVEFIDSSNNNVFVTYAGYDSWGNNTSSTDARGNTTTTQYDLAYHVLPMTVTNALDQRTVTQYDLSIQKPLTITDPNGAVTSLAYDTFGRRTSVWSPTEQNSSATAKLTYSDTIPFIFKVEVRTDAPGEATAYQATASVYNGLGQLVQSQSASDTAGQIIVTNQRYNALGKVEAASVQTSVVGTIGTFVSSEWSAIDSRPHTTTAYDALGRSTVITAPDGTHTNHYYVMDTSAAYGYTPTGLSAEAVTDANLHTKHYVRDALGRTVRVREMTGTCTSGCGDVYNLYATTDYGYDVQGNLRRVTDTLGNTTVITFDNVGRKTAMGDPDMGVWSYAYDAAGNLTSQTDAKGQTINFVYDGLNRLTNKQYPVASGQTPVTYTYDVGANGKGNRTRMDDGTGSTTWAYDARGRVITEGKTIAGLGVFTTGTTYDAADRVRTLTYPTGEVVTQTYNARGLFNTLAGATPYVNSTTYNVLGQVTAQAFGNGVTTNYGYNAANYRLQQIQVSALMDLRYQYDPVGNVKVLTDTTNSNQVATFGYDALDRLISASTNAAGTGQYNETYSYDAIGNLLNRSGTAYGYRLETNWVDDSLPAGAVPQGEAWTWVSSNPTPAYGTLAHQSSVAAGTHQHYFGSATQTLTIGAGDRLFAYVYLDPANLPREVMLQWCATDGTCWDHRAYWGENLIGFGTDGTISRQRMGDLPAAGGWVRLEVPAYLVGLEGKTVNGMAFTLYDGRATWDRAGLAHGQPHAVTAVGAYTYTYDANGNMLTRGEWSGAWQQVWDADNRAAAMTNTTTGNYVWFAYDGDGKRVKKIDNGITTTVYAGSVFELNVSTGVTSTYYFANGKRIAVRNGMGLYYLHGDHLGSNNASTSVTGTLTARIGYGPYGTTRWSTAALPAEFGYTGQRYDSGDGWIYDYGARFYDTNILRFLSADSIVPSAGNPQALNRYAYALGNPMRYVDPSGHAASDEGGANTNCENSNGAVCLENGPLQYAIASPDLYPRTGEEARDYVQISVGAGLPSPLVIVPAWGGTITWDRYGRTYLGANGGPSTPGLSASAGVGTVETGSRRAPTPQELKKHFTGGSSSLGVGALLYLGKNTGGGMNSTVQGIGFGVKPISVSGAGSIGGSVDIADVVSAVNDWRRDTWNSWSEGWRLATEVFTDPRFRVGGERIWGDYRR